MIHVELDHIYSEDDAIRQIREIIDNVDRSKEPVVITRSNKARVVIIDIEHIEELTGKKVTPVTPMAQVMTPSPNAEAVPTPAEPMVDMPAANPTITTPAASTLPDLPASTADAEASAPTMNLPTFTAPSIPEPNLASAGMPISTPAPDAAATTPAPEPVPAVADADKPRLDEHIQEGPIDPTNSSPLA